MGGSPKIGYIWPRRIATLPILKSLRLCCPSNFQPYFRVDRWMEDKVRDFRVGRVAILLGQVNPILGLSPPHGVKEILGLSE